MNVFQSCSDTSDATPLSSSQGLYLKPVARLNISVQLPGLKKPGKSISNWEVMEKLRHYAVPEEFINIKVAKSTLEVVRFEGEIESRSKLPAVLARLDGRSLKLSGFQESLKVRAAEAKPDFPNRHAWDSYFRDAKNMNEMKPGERPDTIHITNLPCKWFSAKSDASKPSEYILRKMFEVFGEVRCVDIPMLDPFRSKMKSHISGIKMFSNNQNMIFEAYIQFKEYICFVKAMDSLRGMKLLHKDGNGKAFTASVKVDFDKTKHLSDSSIRRRRVERERLMAKEREREDEERRKKEEEDRKLAAERKRVEEERVAKLERQRQREERRKAKMLERLEHREADEMNKKIATEERLLLIAQRRLESYRLLGELFNRLKAAKESEQDKNREKYIRQKDGLRKYPMEKSPDDLHVKEKELRDKLVNKFKHSDLNDKLHSRHGQEHKTDIDLEPAEEHEAYNDPNMDNEEYNRGFHRGRGRGGRFNRGRWRNNNQFRGQHPHPPQMPFQPFPNRAGFFPLRGYPRWSRFPRGRGGGDPGFFPPPFIDPYYLANDPYYKYFQKIAFGDRHSRSKSLSRSRSRSYSRSHSRSYSRSRSRSRSRSQSRSRSRHKRTRSYSRSSRSQTRSRSRSRDRRRRRSRRSRSSRRKSHSSRHSHKSEKKEKDIVEKPTEDDLNKKKEESSEKLPSVHTWSRSPSRSRSLSWEKRKDEPSSSTGHKHKKVSKKKKKKKKKKDDKE